MRHQSKPAHNQALLNLFSASLQEYKNQTGIALSQHPIAERLRDAYNAKLVTDILQEQVLACNKFEGTDRITKSLGSVVSVLYALSAAVDLNWVCSKIRIGLFHLLRLFYSHSLFQNQYIPGLLSYSLYVSFLHFYVRIFF